MSPHSTGSIAAKPGSTAQFPGPESPNKGLSDLFTQILSPAGKYIDRGVFEFRPGVHGQMALGYHDHSAQTLWAVAVEDLINDRRAR
jgi:hypothetical protein